MGQIWIDMNENVLEVLSSECLYSNRINLRWRSPPKCCVFFVANIFIRQGKWVINLLWKHFVNLKLEHQ